MDLARVFSQLFGPKELGEDESIEKQRDDIRELIQRTAFGSNLQPECDELPKGHGDFGYSPTNPIPVNGPLGEFVYLNRLRSQGVGFLFHRIGSVASPVCNYLIDYYELVSTDSKTWVDLYFSMYHPRRSTRVPEGLELIPWSSVAPGPRGLLKLDGSGTNARVDNFPLGLPEAILRSPRLASVSPGMPRRMARIVQAILDEHPDGWKRPQVN